MPNDSADSAVARSSMNASEFEINEHYCGESNNPRTKLEKIKSPSIRKAYLNGYEAGLTNRLAKIKKFELYLTEELALSWLDGWLDGIECVEKHVPNMAEVK